MNMSIQEAAASLIVPVETQDVPVNDPQDTQTEVLPAEAAPVDGEEDTRTEEQKLLDELASEELGDDAPEQEENIPAAPHSWSKEDGEAWKDLTPQARDIILRREGERDKFIAETGRKSAEARKQIERQAMDAVAQHAEQYAQRLQVYAQQMLPAEPDIRLLYSDDQNMVLQYQRQKASYDVALAQHQQMQHEVANAQAQANAARDEAQRASLAEEAQRLAEQLPEWADPSARTNLLTSLQEVGAELGYPAELMAEAGATDILALKKAMDWRKDAMKYRQLMSKRMETVRSAKSLPTMTRPGSGNVRGAQPTAEDKQALIDRFNRERSPEAAAALLMTRNR